MKPNVFAQNSTDVKPNTIVVGIIGQDKGDFGADWAGYTPPTPDTDTDIRVVKNTNATGGKRLYVYANGEWSHNDLT